MSAELNYPLCIFCGSAVLVWFVVSGSLALISCVQFQASSWKSLILKVCRGAYPPLPNHLPYEMQYLIKHMFKTNPKDRPSVHTILTSHRVSRLLRSHLPSQVGNARDTLCPKTDRDVKISLRSTSSSVVSEKLMLEIFSVSFTILV